LRSHVTAGFRRLFQDLPAEVQRRAREAYLIWRENPAHPGIQYKRVHPHQPIYSVRIGLDWRAVGVRRESTMIWFWIGSHADYDGLLKRL
jgi:hypothetical protein